MTGQKSVMPRWLRLIPAALLFAAVLAGCGHGIEDGEKKSGMELYPFELGTFEGLDAETEWRIIQDHCNRYMEISSDPLPNIINDYRINRYYGTHNGYVLVAIIKIGAIYSIPAVLSYPYQIAGIELPWHNTSRPFPMAWNNGKFYEIVELYNSGQLTRDDLESIARYGQPEDNDES